jgi:hypothetical protein
MNQVAYPEFGRSIKLSQGKEGRERALAERLEAGLRSIGPRRFAALPPRSRFDEALDPAVAALLL